MTTPKIEYRPAWVEENTILRVQVGSGVHGVTVDDQDDRDEMGICVEPRAYVLGLRKFEQFEFRTQQKNHRSGPGDLDLVIYSLRKWMRLALKGNPTILLPMWVPEEEIVSMNPWGLLLRDNRESLISREAGRRFLGYMRGQQSRLLNGKPGHTNRPELVEKYGYDTKFAYHMIRLGVQGRELMNEGKISLPMNDHWREWLISVRVGKRPLEEVMQVAKVQEAALEREISTSRWPEHADQVLADYLLITTHEGMWPT